MNLEEAVGKRDDVNFIYQHDAGIPDIIQKIGTLGETDWVSSVRSHLPRITFTVCYAPHFEARGNEFIARDNEGTLKIIFLTRFFECDRKILPMIPRASLEWKERVLLEFYQRVHDNPSTEIGNKILSASYLLDRSSALPDEVLARTIDCLLRLQEDDMTNWDLYDLLHRHTEQMTPVQRRRFRDWREAHPRIPRQPAHDIDEGVGPALGVGRTTLLTTDSQNIHTASINDAMQHCLDVLSTTPLCDMDVDDMFRFVLMKYPLLAPPLRRIRTDPTLFHGKLGRLNVRLVQVFEWVFSYIFMTIDEETRTTLWQRLNEELSDAQGTCCTGHLTRLVNVLVGFHPGIHLTIGEDDHRKLLFCQIMSDLLSSDESIINDMIDPAPGGSFCRFLVRNRERFLQEFDGVAPPDLDRVVWILYPSLKEYRIFSLRKHRCHLL